MNKMVNKLLFTLTSMLSLRNSLFFSFILENIFQYPLENFVTRKEK